MQDYLAERLMQPIEQIGAWLFRVARNRITDWFRRKKPVSLEALEDEDTGGELGGPASLSR